MSTFIIKRGLKCLFFPSKLLFLEISTKQLPTNSKTSCKLVAKWLSYACMHACNTIIAPEIIKPEILLTQKKYIMVALVESIV